MGWKEIDLPVLKGGKGRIRSDWSREKNSASMKEAHARDPSLRERMREARLLTLNQVIEDFRETHGDRYDYSKVVYEHARSKVKITCKKHGEFLQSPNYHKRGGGCPKCFDPKKKGPKLTDPEKVIAQFRTVHGDRYDYSKMEYQGNHEKIIVVCPDHGEFSITPGNHKSGKTCVRCRPRVAHNKLDTKSVIAQFKKVHGSRYDYSKVEYVNNTSKVTIICPDHGEFLKTPVMHKQGKDCPKCSWAEREQRKTRK